MRRKCQTRAYKFFEKYDLCFIVFGKRNKHVQKGGDLLDFILAFAIVQDICHGHGKHISPARRAVSFAWAHVIDMQIVIVFKIAHTQIYAYEKNVDFLHFLLAKLLDNKTV